jgi:Na+-translocating ferredoxin:NAD+ oxidoreductase RnfA subunit
MSFFGVVFTLVLVSNLILEHYLGLCLVSERGKRLPDVLALGLVISVVTAFTSIINWVIFVGVLAPLGLVFLRTIVFALVNIGFVTLLVVLTRRVVGNHMPVLLDYLGAVATNSLVLGVALIVSDVEYTFASVLATGLSSGIAFAVVGVALGAIREQLAIEKTPKAMRGIPSTFLTLALLALAFLAFDHVIIANLAR